MATLSCESLSIMKVKGHVWAVETGKKSASAHFTAKPGLQNPSRRFQDVAVFFGVERIPPAKLDQYVELMKHRGQDIKGDRNIARDLYLSFFNYLHDEEKDWMDHSVSIQVGVDEDSDLSVREWLSIVVDCDKNPFPGGFLFALPCLSSDDLTAEGMFAVLKDCGLDWSKVFWLVRDGASVMDKLGDLLIDRLNPFMISIWCANHRMNLMFKGCVQDSPDL